ncbi:hypothetical protein [Leisingera sp. F5]|uniref:hypothetical protein n=1 Tax=Leisingera sp. F5 TaxID=1813816 RepID=UPI000B169A57|nr:hypothetical protein [Leisingera sp. F5]
MFKTARKEALARVNQDFHAAHKTLEEVRALLARIGGTLGADAPLQPAPCLLVARIAQMVARTVKRVLATERQKLKKDADYVRGLRQKWELEDEARLTRISRGEMDGGPK